MREKLLPIHVNAGDTMEWTEWETDTFNYKTTSTNEESFDLFKNPQGWLVEITEFAIKNKNTPFTYLGISQYASRDFTHEQQVSGGITGGGGGGGVYLTSTRLIPYGLKVTSRGHESGDEITVFWISRRRRKE